MAFIRSAGFLKVIKMIDKKGKQFLIVSILCIMFFAFGVAVGASVIWKNFRVDQLAIKKKVAQIEREQRLVTELERILSMLLEENFENWR